MQLHVEVTVLCGILHEDGERRGKRSHNRDFRLESRQESDSLFSVGKKLRRVRISHVDSLYT